MPQAVATLLNARWIVPVEPEGQVLEHHALAIQDGRILDLLPQAEAATRYRAETCLNLDRHVLMPGLINAHTHASMTLLRGLADDLPLMTWLQDHIWPAEARWVDPEFVRDGTRLAIAEMLRGGVTCFNDMYFFPEVTAAVARDSRDARLRRPDRAWTFPPPTPATWTSIWTRAWPCTTALQTEPLAPYRLRPPRALHGLRAGAGADRPTGGGFGNSRFTSTSTKPPPKSPSSTPNTVAGRWQRLEQLGLLSPRLLAVHMTQLESAEIERLAQAGAHVVHCPESNLKLASGFCPVARLDAAGVNVAIGTDGAASNNDLDLFGEMRTAALLGKGVAGDAARPARGAGAAHGDPQRRPGAGAGRRKSARWNPARPPT